MEIAHTLQEKNWWQSPAILKTKVFHKRLIPRENAFNYMVYYLCAPLSMMDTLPKLGVKRNRFAASALNDSDHGNRTNEDCRIWADNLFAQFNIPVLREQIALITMPRIFGYVFNPVSFWLHITPSGDITAVIAEVNNTFGETHSYVLANADGSPLSADAWLETEKYFHVSPFLPVEGYYKFRFAINAKGISIWIDYYNKEGELTLLTSMMCKAKKLSRLSLVKQSLAIPVVSVKVIALIHFQAIRLMLKNVRYIRKPKKPDRGVTQWR